MSKMLISHINEWAAGTISASTEHPSFPVINTQHRWYKKVYRSKYGVGSGGGFFRVTTANQKIYFAEQKVVDGQFSAWTTVSNLTNWTETLAGTTTITRAGSIYRTAPYSVKFTVDASASISSIGQAVTLAAGAAHLVSIWHNIPVGATAQILIRDSASNVWLKSDGTWSAVATGIALTGTGTWAQFKLDFTSHASYTAYQCSIYNATGSESKSLYVDECVIAQVYTATLTPGDYDAATLAVEVKTQLDTAGALTYSCVYDEATFKFTIGASAEIILRYWLTTDAAWALLGFSMTYSYSSYIQASFTSWYAAIHSGEILYCASGSTKTLRLIGIKNHNLQSTATIEVRYYSDAFLTQVDSETLTWHEGQIATRTAQNYEYYAIYVSDPKNPAGYIEIGLVWAGDANVLHYGFTAEREETPEDPSIETESEDGQGSTIQLSHYLERTYTFDAVEPNTDRALLRAIFAEIGKTRPCFIVESPPSSGDVGEDAEYVKIIEWVYQHIAGNYWRLEMAIRSER